MIALFILGAATWWAAEYLVHRFVGHRKRSRTQFAVEHRRHHSEGAYFAPTSKKVATALPVFCVVVASLWWPLGFGALIYVAGLISAYVGYEILHRRLHTHPPSGPYGRWARRHHFFHHFHDPKSNHGVTSPIGDWVFKTNVRHQKIRVPERLAMRWLIDPATQDVFEAHQADYELVRLPGASEIRGAETS